MSLTKPELRQEMRARLRSAVEGRSESSRAICDSILRSSAYRAAVTVALFDAMAAEPDVGLLWTVAPRRFVYPLVQGDELVLVEVSSASELVASAGGARYREPAPDPARLVPPHEIDLILVPGLAFTRDGLRLGRGGGHYDRLLARTAPRTRKIGVCFEVQILDSLPAEPHDMRVDAVITEASQTL